MRWHAVRRKEAFEVRGMLVSKASLGTTCDDSNAKAEFRVQNEPPPPPPSPSLCVGDDLQEGVLLAELIDFRAGRWSYNIYMYSKNIG